MWNFEKKKIWKYFSAKKGKEVEVLEKTKYFTQFIGRNIDDTT